jgi:hypothetical protein
MRTVANYIASMEHALHSTQPDTVGLSSIDVLNDAGNALFDMHDWPWKRRLAGLTITANQDTIELPADFESLIAVEEGDTSTLKIIQTTVEEVLKVRGNQAYDPLVLYIAVNIDRPRLSDDSGKPDRFQPILAEIAPTPAVGVPSGVLKAEYTRRWIDLDAVDTNVVPDIPRRCERLLVNLCRAFIIEWEDGIDPIENTLVEKEFHRLRVAYGRTQRKAGPIRNTVGSPRKGTRYPHTFITRQ